MGQFFAADALPPRLMPYCPMARLPEDITQRSSDHLVLFQKSRWHRVVADIVDMDHRIFPVIGTGYAAAKGLLRLYFAL